MAVAEIAVGIGEVVTVAAGSGAVIAARRLVSASVVALQAITDTNRALAKAHVDNTTDLVSITQDHETRIGHLEMFPPNGTHRK